MQPEPILRAAVRWLEELPTSGENRCRALFTHHADFGDISPTQYDAALAWLRTTGLLDNLHSSFPAPQRIYLAALRSGDALWLADADILVRDPSELPQDAVRAAKALGLDETQAYRHLRVAWGKIDLERRSEIGAAGEEALVKLLTASTVARVQHVSPESDGYGYDIAVHARQHGLHIEAKTTIRRHRVTVFLSRNEHETMRADPRWQLVLVRLTPGNEIAAVATVPNAWIADQVPEDRDRHGSWESCRLEIPHDAMTAGIQQLRSLFAAPPSPLLDGTTGWLG